MSDVQTEALFQRSSTDGGSDHILAAVDVVNLEACGVLGAGAERLVALLQQQLFSVSGYLALGFAVIQEVLVAFAEFLCLLGHSGVYIRNILSGVQQFFGQLLASGHFFCHNIYTTFLYSSYTF